MYCILFFRCKRYQCFKPITAAQRKAIFTQFYSLHSKDLQDSYLRGLITVDNVKQRRSRKAIIMDPAAEGSTMFSRNGSLYYKVRISSAGITKDVPVCRNAFMSLHGITRGRLRTVQASLL